MQKMKRLLAVLLTLVMVLSLAACAPADNADDTKPADTKPADTKPADTEPSVDPHAEAVTVRWLVPDSALAGRDEIHGAVADYVKEKLNIDLEMVYIENGGSPETIMVTGSGWDLGYCDASVFVNMAARNAFLDLGPYVEQGYLPNVTALLTEDQQKAHVVNGKQFGFAAVKDLVEGWDYMFNLAVIEDELGLTAPTEWQSCFDLIDHWYDVKEALVAKGDTETVPGGYGIRNMPAWFQVDGLIGTWNNTLVCTNIDGVNGYDDIDESTVFCPYFTEDFKEWVALRNKLYEDGIIFGIKRPSDETRTFGNQGVLWQASIGNLYWDPNSYEFRSDMLNQKYSYNYSGYVQAVSIVVNANTENPERVLELMDLMYSDEYINNTLRFGIEGIDWEDADNDGAVEWLERNADPDNNNKYWRHWYGSGRSYNLLLGKVDASEDPEKFVTEMKKANEEGVPSPNLGFSVDQTNIVNEVTACSALVTQYMDMLMYPASMADYEATLAEFQEKLKANGIDKIIADVQAQLDAFHAG